MSTPAINRNAPASKITTMPRITGVTPGDRLRELRARQGLSLRDAARRGGVSYVTIQRIEQGVSSWDNVTRSTVEALARAYGLTVEALTLIASGRDPDAVSREVAAASAAHLEDHPQFSLFPVYGSVSAGDAGAEPGEESAAIPRDRLRGADPKHIRVYRVNGDCMISEDARRVQKNIAPGDHVAVTLERRPEPGDVVVAWWDDAHKMIIKKYRHEKEHIVLYPTAPGAPSVVLEHEDDVRILGPVIWRGG